MTTPYRTYEIELTASTSTLDQNPPATHTQTFTINVENRCLLDEVSVMSTPWDSIYTYYLGGETEAPSLLELGGAASLISIDASWANTVADCPWELKMEIYDSDSSDWRDLTVSESSVIAWTPNVAFTGAAGGTYAAPHMSVAIQTSDMTLDLTSW